MLHVNKYLFFEVCDRKIDEYLRIMEQIRREYNDVINKLSRTNNCNEARNLVHQLFSIVSACKGTNDEINYLCRALLNTPKETTDFRMYTFWIQMLIDFDRSKIGM